MAGRMIQSSSVQAISHQPSAISHQQLAMTHIAVNAFAGLAAVRTGICTLVRGPRALLHARAAWCTKSSCGGSRLNTNADA
ncbi:hypothetical protein XACLE20_1510038 [Xanthomonas citri pv. citri]|nr:hypothetical protein XAC2911_810023 [Xanthomonas citri pv. citri]CEE73411.1 hypothetical protein XACLE20_1510038 [Xanthomonas citri pv. citri]CEH53926.1 hypothetical protein XACLE3_7110006 [Xanthomonas citri pv. citri]CEH63003.1 hypothetical protein XACLG97_8830006 [Xanthomonas citri pv. citri]